jgi:hypothetical protein
VYRVLLQRRKTDAVSVASRERATVENLNEALTQVASPRLSLAPLIVDAALSALMKPPPLPSEEKVAKKREAKKKRGRYEGRGVLA